MKLATTTGDFSEYTKNPLESVKCIAEAGFKYIDYSFEFDYKTKTGFFGSDFNGHLGKLKETADKAGVRFVQAHAPMGAPVAEDNSAFIRDNMVCIEACNALGIENLVIHSGYRAGLTKQACFEQNKAFFMPLLACAEKNNVNILVENFNKMYDENLYWIDNANDLFEFLAFVNHPRCLAVWDTGHGNMQEMPQHEALKILKKYVRALHVQDNMGNSDAHLAPFFGTTNLDSLMHGLSDIGYNGYFTFEATSYLTSATKKRPFEKSDKLLLLPLKLRIEFEKLLYETGKHILTEYNCFEA